MKEPEEFERLLEIYNRYPIACLTIHPRIQKQFYKGTVHRDWFAWAAERSRNPLCYNGDLVTVEDCGAFAADFPAVDAVMIGRGAIADPALLRKLTAAPPPPGRRSRISPGHCTSPTRTSTVRWARRPSG